MHYCKQILLVLIILAVASFAMPRTVTAQTQYDIQVGARGDDASVGNMGVGAEIRTHIYNLVSPDLGNSFWVGDYLQNGAFIQFGYMLLGPGNYCSYGETIAGSVKCFGSPETVGYGDARWFWQYWPNPEIIDFYGGIGSANSVGHDGSWHEYQISPNNANGWNFVLDGQPVWSFNNYKMTKSKDQAHIIAEELTSAASAKGSLGPVEFRNLSYLTDNSLWQPVASLSAMSGCNIAPNCGIIPYGVSIMGPNDIMAGTGEPPNSNGVLLWPRTFTFTLWVPSGAEVSVDGRSYTSSNGSVNLSLLEGTHTVVAPEIVPIDSTNRLRFLGWGDGSTDLSRIIDLSSDTSLQVNYIQQYTLMIISPVAASGDGWYDEGDIALFSTDSAWRVTGTNLQVFSGWYDNGALVSKSSSDFIQVDRPCTLQAVWSVYSLIPALILILYAVAFVYVYKKYSGGGVESRLTHLRERNRETIDQR